MLSLRPSPLSLHVHLRHTVCTRSSTSRSSKSKAAGTACGEHAAYVCAGTTPCQLLLAQSYCQQYAASQHGFIVHCLSLSVSSSSTWFRTWAVVWPGLAELKTFAAVFVASLSSVLHLHVHMGSLCSLYARECEQLICYMICVI